MVEKESKLKKSIDKGTPPSRQQVKISPMVLADLTWAFDLGERVFTADRWLNLYRTWEEYELLSAYLGDGDYCLVATLNKKPLGFVLGTTIDKKGSSWKYGHLLWLAVEPEYSGRGIAGKLVERLTEIYLENEIDIIMVDTEKTNTPAISFFKRSGFSDQGEHVYMFKNIRNDPTIKRAT